MRILLLHIPEVVAGAASNMHFFYLQVSYQKKASASDLQGVVSRELVERDSLSSTEPMTSDDMDCNTQPQVFESTASICC